MQVSHPMCELTAKALRVPAREAGGGAVAVDDEEESEGTVAT